MKEGNMQKFGAEGSIGHVSAKLTLEGPIVKDKTSFIVSGRRSHNNALAANLITYISLINDEITREDGNANYYFYDLTAKINHRFSANDRIYLSAYMGDDKYSSQLRQYHRYTIDTGEELKDIVRDFQTDGGLKWGNSAAAFRWNHVFSPQLFSNTMLSYSRYRFNNWSKRDYIDKIIDYKKNPTDTTIIYRDYYEFLHDSGVKDWSIKTDFDYMPLPNHYIRFGADAIHHTYNVGSESISRLSRYDDYNESSLSRIYAWEYSAYFEDDVKLTERLKANVGLHWSAFNVEKKFYNSLQPRISARYLITPQLSVKASYSRMAQYVYLLTNAGIGMPSDLWVPSTARIRPQTSDQAAIGLAQSFREIYEVSLEGYYKTMSNVLEYREGSGFFNAGNRWEQKVVQGKGRSYGMELYVEKKTGSFTGWVGYALSWTDRQFDELNNGKRFPYKYDRRHDFSIALTHRIENLEMSCAWVYGTGNCVTLPVGIYHADIPISGTGDIRFYDYGERNSYRMKAYHRLDLSITVTFVNKKWGEHKVAVGLYNAYNRKNPFYIDIENITEKHKFVQYSLFPIIPSISYHFKF